MRLAWLHVLIAFFGATTLNATQAPRDKHLALGGEVSLNQDPDRDITIFLVTAEGTDPVSNWFSLTGGVSVLGVIGDKMQDDSLPPVTLDASTIGVRLLAGGQFNPFQLGRVRPYAELGIGTVFSAQEFPPGGTFWNFTQRWGIGIEVGNPVTTRLRVAFYRTHISNGKGFGHPRNPSFDGRGVLVSFALPRI